MTRIFCVIAFQTVVSVNVNRAKVRFYYWLFGPFMFLTFLPGDSSFKVFSCDHTRETMPVCFTVQAFFNDPYKLVFIGHIYGSRLSRVCLLQFAAHGAVSLIVTRVTRTLLSFQRQLLTRREKLYTEWQLICEFRVNGNWTIYDNNGG